MDPLGCCDNAYNLAANFREYIGPLSSHIMHERITLSSGGNIHRYEVFDKPVRETKTWTSTPTAPGTQLLSPAAVRTWSFPETRTKAWIIGSSTSTTGPRRSRSTPRRPPRSRCRPTRPPTASSATPQGTDVTWNFASAQPTADTMLPATCHACGPSRIPVSSAPNRSSWSTTTSARPRPTTTRSPRAAPTRHWTLTATASTGPQNTPKPSRQLRYLGFRPSSRLALPPETPRILVIIDTPTSPANIRPGHTGK